jgi:D-alanyl-D-alanine carboxypeptidase
MTTTRKTSRRLAPAIIAAALTIGVVAGCTPTITLGPDLPTSSPSDVIESRLSEVGEAVLESGATAFVGTVHGEKHTTSIALGLADRETERAAEASDQFQMGSTTKTVTATVALQLVGEGLLSLDDTVEHWLPGALPNGEEITVRMLLQHTSGIFDYTADEAFAMSLLAEPTRKHTPDELLALAIAHEPTFAPGAGWAYSNTGFVVVGMILGTVTDQPIADLITERVIVPLGLENTYWAPDGLFHGEHLNGYYRTEPNGSEYIDVSDFPLTYGDAAGALVSTTADLGAFERALQSGELLDATELDEMRTTVEIPGTDGQYAYGLGLMRINTPDGNVWGHTGGTLGYLTQAWASEDGTRSIVTNVPTGASTPVGPDSGVDAAAGAAASSLFDLLTL